MEFLLSQLEEVIGKYGSPIYIYDGDKIRQHSMNFMNSFRKTFPTFRQYFAVKALPNIHILKILHECGMGFDCSSVSEIKMCRQITLSKEDILYTSNYTSVEDFDYALENEVILNLDDIDGFENMLIAIKKNNNLKIPNLLSFRLNPRIGKTDSEAASNVLGGENTKFGIPDNKIVKAYELAKIYGVKEFGIHVMTGSCILDENYWYDLINVLFETIENLKNKLDIELKFIDLGGGIGIPYKPNEKEVNLDLLIKNIYDSLIENTKRLNIAIPDIYMECGRYITGKFGYLITKCKSIKIGYNDKKFYGLDSCMANLMRPGMYGAYHHISVPRLEHVTEFESVNIVGTLCENNDWFAKDRNMPIGILKEDIFVIHDVGAHGHCMGFQYNGKMRSPEILFIENKFVLIREGEKI